MQGFSTILEIGVTGLILAAIPIALFSIWTHRGRLESIQFKERFGELVQGLNTKGKLGAYWNVVVLIRWLITAIILVVLRDYCALQIISLLTTSILVQIIIIQACPLKAKLENRQAIFNEWTVSLYLYILMSLTDFNILFPDLHLLSLALISIVGLSICANLFTALYALIVMVMGKHREKSSMNRVRKYVEPRPSNISFSDNTTVVAKSIGGVSGVEEDVVFKFMGKNPLPPIEEMLNMQKKKGFN